MGVVRSLLKPIAVLAALATPGLVVAGERETPRVDTQLGTQDHGNLAYFSHSRIAQNDQRISFDSACRSRTPGKWRVTGGGFSLGAPGDEVIATRPGDRTKGDPDRQRDDEWQLVADVSAATGVTVYSICSRWDDISYETENVEATDEAQREGSASCGDKELTGGGVAADDGYLTASFPDIAPNTLEEPTQWIGRTVDGSPSSSMKVDVVCAKRHGLEVMRDTVQNVYPGDTELLLATCGTDPWEAVNVVGGGMKSERNRPLVPFESRPWDSPYDSDGTPADGWFVRVYNASDKQASAGAYAVCSKPERP